MLGPGLCQAMLRSSIMNLRIYRYLAQPALQIRRERRDLISRLGLQPDKGCPPQHPVMITRTRLSLEATIACLGSGMEDPHQGWRRQPPNLPEHLETRALSTRSVPIPDSLATSLLGQARTTQAHPRMQHRHGKRHRRTFRNHICLRLRHHWPHLAVTAMYQAGHPQFMRKIRVNCQCRGAMTRLQGPSQQHR